MEGDKPIRPELISEILDKRNVIAVVGASQNPDKYGHKVYVDLKQAGYKVYAVNPNTATVNGDKAYPTLTSLLEKPDVVNMVVPPQVTDQIVRECKKLGITRVWMQPGSESDEAIEYCEGNGIEVVHGVCIMIQRRQQT